MPLDNDGQPLNTNFNAGRRLTRSVDELLGIARGLTADGQVTKEEAEFLHSWLTRNHEAAEVYPGNLLLPRIEAMLADGTLDSSERDELLDLLRSTTGEDCKLETVASLSGSLPLTSPAPPVVFRSRAFCLTGKFALGPRRSCERLIRDLGGALHSKPTWETHYVVVGLVGSRDWAHSSFGRKIEYAIQIRGDGANVAIVSEEHFASHLPA